ncbi:nucleotidyl transferase AbiEii/AbiGii toxin family protein [Bradyrhizobium cosmicum]|uniref:nucleotidyl transferase AbiEii/AbiGii toxin family protein n=1 Tax=Bradyrhizobium cosmicum TaxID=1404864 RepID=UPI0011654693|nr:nucleotidyl transferase AbiEii/AbiGii toxin family protein [Bradyrhizobium cosmicum]QDP24297.1 nucleotidyl transferase AbiEii/AbiGii toxin family protein [Bradyrhizobium cosmicum]
MSGWLSLLGRTLDGLSSLEQLGQPVPDWVLGGGTALMLYANHRFSRDIDAFIDDPQYLGFLSPETTDVWNCEDWDKAAHYLKLRYPEGEIDFIVSGAISDLDPAEKEIDLTSVRAGWTPTIKVEPPAEIALKKMYHRATMLKPRDIFDIAVIMKIAGDSLTANLGKIASRKDDLVRRVAGIRVDYLKSDLAELDIQPGWEREKETCLETVRSLVAQIPAAG